jgi:hypothetical protein
VVTYVIIMKRTIYVVPGGNDGRRLGRIDPGGKKKAAPRSMAQP